MSAPKELMEAFEFTEADLDANRRGIISDDQRQRLAHIAGSLRAATGNAIWVVCIFVVLGILFWSTVYVSDSPHTLAAAVRKPAFLPVAAVINLLLFGIVGFSVLRSRRNSAGLSDPSLALLKAQGKAGLNRIVRHSRGIPYTYYAVTIGDKTFQWLGQIPTLFVDGALYCIYYCKSGPYEQVLTVDRLDS